MAGIRWKKVLITVVIFAGIFCVTTHFLRNIQAQSESGENSRMLLGRLLLRQAESACFLMPGFLEEGEQAESMPGLVWRWMMKQAPLLEYAMTKEEPPAEDEELARIILQQEGRDEDNKEIAESGLDYEQDAMHIEGSMLEDMERENSKFRQDMEASQNGEETGEREFIPAENPAYTYDWSKQWGYEELVSNFFAVDNSTELKEEYLDLDRLLYSDLSVDKDGEGPQILIYHTHSQEGFADSVPGDPSTTIVGAGEELSRILREEYGFGVMHYTGEFDAENRDYAYSNSLPVIEQLLDDNPTIQVVIDLHRDAVQEGTKLLMDLQGRPTARFMFFNGMSCIRGKGDISYLENPYIQDNLNLSFQAQVAANEYYPGIARKIYLKAYRYNMHLRPRSMLIELGAQTNTVEEIMNACGPLAHIISIVLDKNL